jgi:galactokinase
MSGFDREQGHRLRDLFDATYGLGEWREHFFVQSPGRTEIAGNHTDHQGGSVIAAAVDRYVRGVFAANEKPTICVLSEGFDPVELRVDELEARASEVNTTASLVRGMAAQFAARGYVPKGFDAVISSDVLSGSGLSSSAAFELELAQAMNVLWAKGVLSPEELAVMAQTTEREWFGKPCGLMDQAAVALGGIQHMSFAKPGVIDADSIACDFSTNGYTICLTAIGSSHADLTDEYAAVPGEMFQIAHALGVDRLSQTSEAAFAEKLSDLRATCGDRAVLRALHYFREERLVEHRAEALRAADMGRFLALTRLSGASSAMYLQNVSVAGSDEQPAMVGLAVADELLGTDGANRIHGGGFGGTIQSFVPNVKAESFCQGMDRVFGEGACQPYQVDHDGARAWRM